MLRGAWKEIRHYPSAVIGLVIILIYAAISVYTVIAIPYEEAVRLWRGGEDIWGDNPRLAAPTWYNLFRKKKLPLTIKMDDKHPSVKDLGYQQVDDDLWVHDLEYAFDFQADEFPQDVALFFQAAFQKKAPYVSIVWIRPDGKEIRLEDLSIRGQRQVFLVSQAQRLHKKLRLPEGMDPVVPLFADDYKSENPQVLKGTYKVRLETTLFEADSTINSKLVVYGKVHGWAGTDHLRRDLSVALLWGAPVALSFGLLAATGVSVLTMIIAAVGVWFGGWVDAAIQRITEVNMVLPVLPILIMVGIFISRSLVVMLLVIVALSIFGASIKTNRAIFLQIKASPYIEAARSYGASDLRIIFFYMIPRIIPTIIPSLVLGIPSFVFLEASLAVLGLGDPVLPTWGKILDDARVNGALLQGHFYWVLLPSFALMITGIAFAMLGFSLDRIFNPRLREL